MPIEFNSNFSKKKEKNFNQAAREAMRKYHNDFKL